MYEVGSPKSGVTLTKVNFRSYITFLVFLTLVRFFFGMISNVDLQVARRGKTFLTMLTLVLFWDQWDLKFTVIRLRSNV